MVDPEPYSLEKEEEFAKNYNVHHEQLVTILSIILDKKEEIKAIDSGTLDNLRRITKTWKEALGIIKDFDKYGEGLVKYLKAQVDNTGEGTAALKEQLKVAQLFLSLTKTTTDETKKTTDAHKGLRDSIETENRLQESASGIIRRTKEGVIDLSATYKAFTGRQTSRLAILFRSLDTLRAIHGKTFKEIFEIPERAVSSVKAYRKEGLEGALLTFGLLKKEKQAIYAKEEYVRKDTGETVKKGQKIGEAETGKTLLNLGGLAKGAGAMMGLAGTVAVIGQIFEQVGQKIVNSIMEVVNILRKASPVFEAMFKMLEMSFKLALMPLATIIGLIFMPYVRKMLRASADQLKGMLLKLKEKGAGLTGADLEKIQISMAGEALSGMFEVVLSPLLEMLGVGFKLVVAMIPWAVYELGSMFIKIYNHITGWLLTGIVRAVEGTGRFLLDTILQVGLLLTQVLERITPGYQRFTENFLTAWSEYSLKTTTFFNDLYTDIESMEGTANEYLSNILHAAIFDEGVVSAIFGQSANTATMTGYVSGLLTSETFSQYGDEQTEGINTVAETVQNILTEKGFEDITSKTMELQKETNDILYNVSESVGAKEYYGMTLEEYMTAAGLTHMSRYEMEQWKTGGGGALGLQEGGLVKAPIIAHVGEKGPELIIPLDRLNLDLLGPPIGEEKRVEQQSAKEVKVYLSIGGNVYGVTDLERTIQNGVEKAMYALNWRGA